MIKMLKTRLILVLHLVAMVGCSHKPNAEKVQALPSVSTLPPPVLTALDRPVILIYMDSLGNLNPEAPRNRIDTAVWGDGRIVWRVDHSLLQGRIDTKKIDELLQRLHREGVFGDGKASYHAFGPNSSFEVIKVQLADRQLELCSWHELYGQGPDALVTSQGVELLEGRNRDAVIAAQPPEWKRFRSVWSDIRLTVRSWVPSEGQPFVGSIPIDSGN
jgi:hypothetical protein